MRINKWFQVTFCKEAIEECYFSHIYFGFNFVTNCPCFCSISSLCDVICSMLYYIIAYGIALLPPMNHTYSLWDLTTFLMTIFENLLFSYDFNQLHFIYIFFIFCYYLFPKFIFTNVFYIIIALPILVNIMVN